MDRNRQHEVTAIVTGVGLAGIALFLCVSLYTHTPYDVMDFTAGVNELGNKAGFLGAQLAHHAFCLYGVGAWVLTLFLLVFGAMMCIRKTHARLHVRTLARCDDRPRLRLERAMDTHTSLSEAYPLAPVAWSAATFIAPLLFSYFGRLGVYHRPWHGALSPASSLNKKATEAMFP